MKIRRISKVELKYILQIITVIAAIVGAVYAIKNDNDNRPAQLCKVLSEFPNCKNVDDKLVFVNLLPAEHKDVWFIRLGHGYPCKSTHSGIPSLRNCSKKSLKNFDLQIRIYFNHFSFRLEDICSDFEIIENDTANHILLLKYKYNTMNAKSEIKIPIDSFCFDKNTNVSNNNLYQFLLLYSFTYDGINKEQEFVVNNYVCFDKDNLAIIGDDYVDRFLTMLYKEGRFTKKEKKGHSLVSVIDEKRQIINSPRRLNDAKFEKFKKEFIESRK